MDDTGYTVSWCDGYGEWHDLPFPDYTSARALFDCIKRDCCPCIELDY